jgi:AraC family transcriptional regulator
MKITIKQLPPRHVAYAANLEGYGDEAMDAAWRTIIGWAGTHHMLDQDTMVIGISFDNPETTPKEKCRYYACVTVPLGTLTPAGIDVMDLPGGMYAVKHYEGNQQGIAGAYKELLGQWLPRSGYVRTASPCYEISLSTPDQLAQGIFVMDICLPIVQL